MNIIHKKLWVALGAAAALTLAGGCGDDGGTTTGDTTTVDTADTSGGDTVVADTVETDTVETDTVETDTNVADTTDTVETDTNVADTADTSVEDTADTVEADTADTVEADTADVIDTDTLDPIPAVVVNEVAAAGDPDDWIELYNGEATAVDLAGWRVRDDDEAHGYVFPAGTTIEAGGYLVVERGDAGFDFGLGGADAVILYDAFDRLADSTVWLDGESPEGGSWGRYPNGTGDFSTRWIASKGAENAENPAVFCGDGAIGGDEICDGANFGDLGCERWGWGGGDLTCEDACHTITQSACTAHAAALVVNEVTSAGDDMIELYNGTGAAIDLAGYQLVDDGDNSYTIPAGTTIAAGAYKVFVKGADHDFGLGGDDAVTLFDAGGAIVDIADWESGEAVVSYCRIPNGVGGFQACATQTFAETNDTE
ncbi:MAG: lamin tail domain-containing protein [Deltaproteobacteria bacterium]|nr:lamin tail domain-containing protein [Deltaproteobacteria bacterium]